MYVAALDKVANNTTEEISTEVSPASHIASETITDISKKDSN